MKSFAAAACVIALVLAALLARHEIVLSSFKSFYCAGRVTLAGANPYLVEPLRACEHAIVSDSRFPAAEVEPAPIPPYVIAAFVPLAMLHANLAHALFIGLLFCSLLVTALALSALTRFPAVLMLASLLSVWFVNVAYGELPPLTVAALALCGLALVKKRADLAGICAAAAMAQPHLALPVCAALWLFVPRSRLALSLCAAVFVAAGLVVGPHTELAYFTTFLPEHASSEITATDQYSLTHALHVAGLPDRAALLAGSLMYVVLAILGIFTGRALARRFEMPAMLAVTPPAFVLLGGTFVHDIQMLAALPFAYLLLASPRGRNFAAALGLMLLCVEWPQSSSRLTLIVAAISAAATAWLIFRDRPPALIRTAAVTIALLAAVILVNRLPAPPYDSSIRPVITAPANASASVAWGQFIRTTTYLSVASPLQEARKIPTWLGLICLICAALIPQRKPEPAAQISEAATA